MRAFSLFLIAVSCIILSAAAISDRFNKLQVLEGTWIMETKKGKLYENWRRVSDSEFYGKSYKLSKADTILLERIRLHETAGEIFYVPIVEDQNNQQPVSFRLISVENSKYTFENKLHDFPQRIIYNIITSDSIVARIEGTKNGQTGGSDYYFKRLK
jgi:hypothetical protein